MNKKRIFVAIKVADDIKNKAKDFQKKNRDLPLRCLRRNDLHITMLAPWDEDKIKDVKKKLEQISGKIRSFQIDFNHITLGPYYNRPKLIWAKGKATKELYELKEELEKIFQKYSQRRFKLHLTLARFKREDAREIIKNWQNQNIFWSQKAKSIVLFESILEDSGARYKVLSEIKL